MRLDQVLDSLGRMVETCCQKCHLILSVFGNAGRQVSLTPFFDPVLQQFEASREFANDGIRGQRNSQCHQGQCPEKSVRRQIPRRARPTRQLHVHDLAIEHQHHKFGTRTNLTLQAKRRCLRFGCPLRMGTNAGARRSTPARVPITNDLSGFVSNDNVAQRRLDGQTPSPANQKGQHRHGQHHRQPDPRVQAFQEHAVLSPAGGQKRNLHRAPSGSAWDPWRRAQWRHECGPCEHQSSDQKRQARGHALPP